MQDFQELRDDEMCPCGSGKTYGECCRKKRIRYGISDGRLVRLIEMTDEAEVNITVRQSRQSGVA